MAQDPFGAQDQAGAAATFSAAGSYDPFFGPDVREDRALSVAVSKGQGAQPERAARILRMQGRTGLPPSVIENNLDEIERKASAANFDPVAFRAQTPALAQWLQAEPQHAAVAQDDMPLLGQLEWLVTAPRRAFAQTMNQQAYSRLRYSGLFGDGIIPSLAGRDLTREERDRMDAYKFASEQDQGDDTWWKKALTGTGSFLANQVPVVQTALAGAAAVGAAGAAVGSVIPGLGTLGGFIAGAGAGASAGALEGVVKSTFQQEAVGAYDEYAQWKDELGRPLDPSVAKMAALATGALNAPIEAGAQELLLKSIPGFEKLGVLGSRMAVKQALLNPTVRAVLLDAAKSYGTTLAGETAQEVAQRAVAILSGEIAKSVDSTSNIPHRGAGDIAGDLAREGVGAAESFALGVLPGPMLHATQQVSAARASQQLLAQVGDAAKASKLVARLPEAAQSFIAQATKGTPTETVYAPVETFTQYWQSKGEDPAKVAADLTGDPKAYDQAVRTGEDLAIPTAAYAVKLAPSEHNAFFSQELRFAPDQMNVREAEAFKAAVAEQLANEPPAAPPAPSPLRQQVVQQLLGAGFPQSAAETQADLYEAAFQTLGERAGVDPVALFNRYGLTIGRSGLDTAPAQAQTASSPDAVSAVPPTEAAGGNTQDAVQGIEGPSATTGAGGDAPIRRVEASVAPAKREGVRALAARRDAHYADVFDAVLTAARHVDPSVNEAELRAAFDERLAFLDELHQQYQESGHNPRRLLEAIAGYGGLSLAAEKNGYVGELKWLRESPANGPFGAYAGVRGVFQERSVNAEGQAQSGLSLDDMTRMLSQDPEFSHIQTLDDLLAELGDISRLTDVGRKGAVNFPGTPELRTSAGVHMERAWWKAHEQHVQEFNQSLLDQLEATSGPEDSRKVPFPHIDGKLSSEMFRATDWTRAERVTVAVSSLVATQRTISKTIAERKMSAADRALPLAMEHGGRYYLADGTHTASAALANGATEIEIVAAPVDEARIGEPVEFHQGPNEQGGLFDTLDTGEQQPRLPEAGAVRDTEQQTPQFEAPFSLTSPTAKPSKAQQTTLFQAFFHGSPHEFERFSTDKIGTGEGAQAYGWGLYFAESKGVAEYYRDALTRGEQLTVRLPGRKALKGDAIDDIGLAAITFLETGARQAGQFQHNRAYYAKKAADLAAAGLRGAAKTNELVKARIDEWADAKIGYEKIRGGLYQVHVDDSNVAKMLDWDAHLKDQPASVQQALAKAYPDHYSPESEDYDANEKGKSIYRRVVDMTRSDKAASLALNAIGIPGIKYLDQGSRSNETKTRNIVVFDDSIVTLTHKDGSPVTAKERREYFQPSKSSDKRGSLTFGADRQMAIQLFEKADLSTFLHESGHFYLEVLGDLADYVSAMDPSTMTDQQKQLLGDYAKLLEWFGVESRDQVGTDQHEQFARGFEAYLMEGKAPSSALRSAFARFRSWLLGVYRSITKLNVELTPEVRGVFDRMLASDAAIDVAQSEGHVAPMFTDAASAGMSEPEFAAYRKTVARASEQAREDLEAKLFAQYQRERKAWWTEERDAMRREVATELGDQPVYVALAAMQQGTRPDGSFFEGETEAIPMRIDRADLERRYSKDVLKPLRRRKLIASEGGFSLDVLADSFGFTSGDEMVQALRTTPSLKSAIERGADERMRAKYGDLLADDAGLHEAAQAAVFGEGRSQVIEAELRALAAKQREVGPFVRQAVDQATREGKAALAAQAREREYERRWLEAEAKLRIAIAEGHKQVEIDALTKQVADLKARRGGATVIRAALPSADVVRQAAAQRVSSMTVRQLRPHTFLVAAQRASKQATERAARADYAGAIQSKQQELLNIELYRQVQRAKDDTQAIRNHAASLMKPAAVARLAKAGESYVQQVAGILDRYELAHVSQKQLDRRASLREWVAAQEAESLPVDVPEDVLNEARRVNWQEVTVDELRGVDEALRAIEHVARLKDRLLKAADQRDFADAVHDIVGSIVEHSKGKRPDRLETRLPQDKEMLSAAIIYASHRKLSSLLRQMDGFKDGGVLWERVLRPLNAAANDETARNAVAAKALSDAFKAYDGQEHTLYQKTFIPAIGDSLSRMGRLMVALNWGNEGNRERLLSDRKRRWTAEQVQAILDTLDARDVAFVNDIWRQINVFWPEIEAKQKRVYGIAPAKVEGVPFSAKGGEFEGGYFPIAYEGQLSAKSASMLEGSFAEGLKKAAYVQATTQRGHTEARVAHYNEPLRLDFGVISEHLTQVVHDLTHHETLIDLSRLLGNREVQDAIYDHYGDIVYDQIKGAIRDVAQGPAPAPNWLRPFNSLRQGGVVARLGWNMVTTALQPFQSVMALPRLGGGIEGAGWLLKGYAKWTRDAATMNNTAAWIRERSSFMASRKLTQIREINEIRNQIGLNSGRVSGWMHDALTKIGVPAGAMPAIADSFFYTIQMGQQLADIPVWLAAYQRAMADESNTEDRAVALADQAVIDTQGSGHVKDLSAVERQPALKFLTTFYSFQNILLQQVHEAFAKTNPKSVRSLSRLSMDAFVLLVAQQIIESQVRAALGRGGDAGDDKPIVEQLIRAGLSEFAGLFVGARELSGPLQGMSPGFPAGLQWMNDVGSAIQQAGQGEADAAFWRAVNSAAGDFFHYPAAQVQRTAEGLNAIMEGRTSNPIVLLTGSKPPKGAK